jgi:hypothetical protein
MSKLVFLVVSPSTRKSTTLETLFKPAGYTVFHEFISFEQVTAALDKHENVAVATTPYYLGELKELEEFHQLLRFHDVSSLKLEQLSPMKPFR